MLIEKSKQLTELAQRKKDLQSFLNNLKTIQTRQSQINQAFTTIKPLLEAEKSSVWI
jgi:ABC-type transporter Mla subunit MlaD